MSYSALERLVADAWERVLHVDSVQAESNFFQLGGYSLTAMHLAAVLERDLGRAVPLAAIFENPTVRELASYIESPTGEHHNGAPRKETEF